MPPRSVYPVGIVEPIYPKVCGRSFFPGGCGLFDGAEQSIPERPLMLVGQDFGTLKYWQGLGTDREPGDGTWSSLKELLASAGIDPRRCFFTNALLGARAVPPIEGPSPGLISREYVDACSAFVCEQVRTIHPSAVVTLGIVPTVLVARAIGLAPQIGCPMPNSVPEWKEVDAIVEPFVHEVRVDGSPPCAFATSVHPVRYWLNAKRRSWASRELSGVAAHEAVWREVRNTLDVRPTLGISKDDRIV